MTSVPVIVSSRGAFQAVWAVWICFQPGAIYDLNLF